MPARSQSSRMAKMILSSASKQGWLPDCFCMCVCVCAWAQAPMCYTPPVSYRSSKWGPRYDRSVSSSSPLIGWSWGHGWGHLHRDWLAQKSMENLSLSFDTRGVAGYCTYVHVHVQFVILFLCMYLRGAQWCMRVRICAPPTWPCAVFCTNTGYLIPHNMTLKNWGHLSNSIHTRWVTATSLLKFYGNQLIAQKN